MQRTLWDPIEGGFFQAQISDSAYYILGKKDRRNRKPPAVDSMKRADTNAQTAFALVHIGNQINSSQAHKLALRTIDYLLQYHLHDERLYHSRDNDGYGPVFNLPHDLFWLLAAVEELQQVHTNHERWEGLESIKKLAVQWLSNTMKSMNADQLPVDLLGLIAWVSAVNQDDIFSRSMTNWALTGIRIDPSTQPDELVLGLKAWERLH